MWTDPILFNKIIGVLYACNVLWNLYLGRYPVAGYWASALGITVSVSLMAK